MNKLPKLSVKTPEEKLNRKLHKLKTEKEDFEYMISQGKIQLESVKVEIKQLEDQIVKLILEGKK